MLAESVNIPTDIVVGSEGVANTDCDMTYMAAKYPGLSNDTLICYGLLPDDDASNEEVDDPWTIIDNDPMDPMFYSTCYRQGTAWEFVGNVECPRCEAANASSVPWRVGRRCISCDEVSRIDHQANTNTSIACAIATTKPPPLQGQQYRRTQEPRSRLVECDR